MKQPNNIARLCQNDYNPGERINGDLALKKVLVAWELGGNFGHVSRLAPVITELLRRGHQVHFAARNVGSAWMALGERRPCLLQAPFFSGRPSAELSSTSYSGILLNSGYRDSDALSGLIEAWRNLMKLTGSTVLLADHAPTAVIAARTLGLRSVLFCSGFAIPPAISPMPPLHPALRIGRNELDALDQQVLKSIIGSVDSGVFGEIRNVADIYKYSEKFVSSFPELDHYPVRPETVRYVGPINLLPSVDHVDWGLTGTKRILLYVQSQMRTTDKILKTLRDTEYDVICAIPGMERKRINTFASDRLRIFGDPINLNHLLKGADLSIGYGGSAAICESLLAGVPLLLIPEFVEQFWGGRRVELLGAGKMISSDASSEDLQTAIEGLIRNRSAACAAQEFKRKYRQFSVEKSIHAICSTLENT